MGNTMSCTCKCSCRSSGATEDNSTVDKPISSTSYPVPFGHVAYTPSLPGAMGPIWDFPLEWWYYAGWATDVTGTKQYTILMQTVRANKLQSLLPGINAVLLYGIGFHQVGSPGQSFATNFVPGSGTFPPPTSSSWSTSFQSLSPPAAMDCELTSGVLGLAGAEYELSMSFNDVINSVSTKFMVKDTFGMVLEGASGAFHKAGGSNSYEYAAPCLTIQEGSTITMNGEETHLAGGSLWLDRQTIGGPIGQSYHEQFTTSQSSPGNSKSLYTGNWVVVQLNDKPIYNLVFFWPKKSEQWIVGTKLKPPEKPLKTIGLEYPSLSTWDNESPVQGVNVLESTEFDLNILNPENPSSSPHWKSPTSGQTYCSAWQLTIKEEVYTMKALIPGSEVFLGTFFFEGAAILTDENGHKVGDAYVEQMGYN